MQGKQTDNNQQANPQFEGNKLRKLETIDFDIVRKCIAPTHILMMNSKPYLEKQIHQISFKELSFMLNAEEDVEADNQRDMQL